MSQSAKPRHEWMPRFWEGCHLYAWLRLLVRNRFAVHPRYIYIALIITVMSTVHMLLRLLQQAWYGDRPRRTEIEQAPIFIVGHWRTGTTLLHELMMLDPRLTCPNTYQCVMPNHFVLTERVLSRLLWFILPSRRPMDNMSAGWDRPQEDEFALCMLGAPSPYLTIAFPNHPPQDQEALDLEGLTPRKRRRWKEIFLTFLRELTFHDPRRLVLKSPTHSFRIPVLLEMFPDARFVHIVRNPYTIYHSTINLWKTLYQTHGMQVPSFRGLNEQVLETFTRLYDRLEKGRQLVSDNRWHELRYEELIADPEGEMRRLYEGLDLEGFDHLLPPLRRYLAEQAGYKTNRYPDLTPQEVETITQRWGEVIQRYGYERPPLGMPNPTQTQQSTS